MVVDEINDFIEVYEILACKTSYTINSFYDVKDCLSIA